MIIIIIINNNFDNLQFNTGSDIGGDEHVVLQSAPVEESVEKCRRLQVVLSGQLKRAPVNPQRFPAPDVFMDLHGLPRVDVLVLHEPVRLVGSDRNGCQVEGTVVVSDVFKSLTVARVSSEPEPVVGSQHCPGAPEYFVVIIQTSLAPVVGGSEDKPEASLLQLHLSEHGTNDGGLHRRRQ